MTANGEADNHENGVIAFWWSHPFDYLVWLKMTMPWFTYLSQAPDIADADDYYYQINCEEGDNGGRDLYNDEMHQKYIPTIEVGCRWCIYIWARRLSPLT